MLVSLYIGISWSTFGRMWLCIWLISRCEKSVRWETEDHEWSRPGKFAGLVGTKGESIRLKTEAFGYGYISLYTCRDLLSYIAARSPISGVIGGRFPPIKQVSRTTARHQWQTRVSPPSTTGTEFHVQTQRGWSMKRFRISLDDILLSVIPPKYHIEDEWYRCRFDIDYFIRVGGITRLCAAPYWGRSSNHRSAELFKVWKVTRCTHPCQKRKIIAQRVEGWKKGREAEIGRCDKRHVER